ncbi:hypothetical protein [Kribbella sp. NPDC051770]|uniref:hypothetical protein n=1 Tax=Kribbella sp. NPDC051770 TaxID=3155413 RepID=UPI00344073CA
MTLQRLGVRGIERWDSPWLADGPPLHAIPCETEEVSNRWQRAVRMIVGGALVAAVGAALRGIARRPRPLEPAGSSQHPIEVSRDSEVEALAALYTAERADATGLSSQAVNELSMGLAYIAATLVLLSGKAAEKASAWVVAFAPLPVCFLAAHWLSLSIATGARTQSAHRLEGLLFARIGADEKEALASEKIGVEATEPILNVGVANWFVKPGIVLPQLGLLGLLAAHGWVMLNRAAALPGNGTNPVRAGLITYAVVFTVLVMMTVTLLVRHSRDTEAAQEGKRVQN